MLSQLEEKYRHKGLVHGGVFLLRPEYALQFVEACEAADIPILGIEGFRVFEERFIQPSQEDTVDFDQGHEETYKRASDFLKAYLGGSMWFEVIADFS